MTGGEAMVPASVLDPRRIALVGASDDSAKASSRPSAFLRGSGFDGEVYPINARRDEVAGERAYRDLRELPEVPDHAFLMTPGAATIEAVRECGELGVPVATVLAGGFAEDGPEGADRQRELLRVAREGGVRLLGPNSLGLVNLRTGLRLTGNAVFAEPDLPVGGTFVVSQSGSMIGSLVSRGKARGVGFSTVVSVGSEADLGIGEICASTLDDPEVTGYLLFLEAVRGAADLADFARAAAERGKPVVAYKLGRSPIAAELAVSHTGALAGEDDVAGEFLAQCGIARVDSLDGLLEAPPLVEKLPVSSGAGGRPAGRRPKVGVVTTTGGGAAMVVDQLGVRGVEVNRPSEQTYELLAREGVDVGRGNIVDLTLAGTRYATMKAALDVLLSAPEFDVLIAVVGSSARLQPEIAISPLVDVAAGSDRALAAFLVPEAPQALRRLTDAGIAAFRSPESCADVVAAAFSRRQPRSLSRTAAGAGRVVNLDEARGYETLIKVGLPVADHVVHSVDELLGDAEIDLPFEYPVAVKVLDADLPHKSDVGGVVLGVTGRSGLRTAARTIVDNVQQAHPERSVRRVIVQPVLGGIGEVLLGYRVDPQVGPLVLLAAGGTLTELYDDRAVRLAPVDETTALEMIDEVVATRVLRGYRGGPVGDLTALASAIVAMSRLVDDPRVVEAEANPLVVDVEGAGVRAIDALVRVFGETGQ